MNIAHAFAAALVYAQVISYTVTYTEQCDKLCAGCWGLRLVASTELQGKWMHAQGGYYPHNTLPEVMDLIATVSCAYGAAVEELLSPPAHVQEQLPVDV